VKAYRLSHKARRDLDDIWDYSRELWGVRRGTAYLHDIRTAIEMVAERPSIGAVLEDFPVYRRRPVGSHMILYRLQDGVIMIVRVLHQNMDATRALSEH
jgi:toxin ParE1/3/4